MEDYIPPTIESVGHVHVGSRCEVQPGSRRGTIMWIGEYDNKKGNSATSKVPLKSQGYWVGVKFDEPVGKCDGSNRGVQYFTCNMNYGGFVRGDKVVEGDFPERDDDLNLSDSEEEI